MRQGAQILVATSPQALAWAHARVPTIRGPIEVSVTNAPGLFSLDLDVPATMIVKAGVPAGTGDRAGSTAVVDGKPVPARSERDRLYVDGVGGGRHSVTTWGR